MANRLKTDLLVIGGGPGGYAAAFRAADLGLQVAIATDEPGLGGVCLQRGCIPSKALLHVTDVIQAARELAAAGVTYGDPDLELDTLREWKNDTVQRLTSGLATLAKKRKVRILHGRAKLAGSTEARIEGEDEQHVRFGHAIVATGSRPAALPDTAFDDLIWDSAAALRLETVPQRLLVVGGGYVGLELGTVYAVLGSRVTITEATDRLMPGVDADLVAPLQQRLEQLTDRIQLHTPVERLERNDGEVVAQFDGDEADPATFDKVLAAVGRRPNTDDVGLDTTEADIDDHGFIAVDAQRKTRDDRLYAVGDVTGGTQLAHEAMHEGKVAAEAVAGGPAAFDPRAIPAVAYTTPQIAWCGLTEHEAESLGREVTITKFPWAASGRALSTGSADGLTKIVSDPESGRVLGVGIVGQQAEALIAEGVLAMEMGAVVDDLALTIHAHPTLSETVGEAAELAGGNAIHMK